MRGVPASETMAMLCPSYNIWMILAVDRSSLWSCSAINFEEIENSDSSLPV
jgi:hypothetical protein